MPTRWRRRLLAFGSGDPTRAICSTMIAQTFRSVRYPILPHIEALSAPTADRADCTQEILHVRHHSLFVPRDFDLSPCFRIVRPALDGGFDPCVLAWAVPGGEADDGAAGAQDRDAGGSTRRGAPLQA